MGTKGRFWAGAAVLLGALALFGCGGGGGGTPPAPATGTLTADVTGTVPSGAVTAPAGVTLSFPASSTLTTAGSIPVTGAITTTVTSSTASSSLPAAGPAGTALAILLDITMKSGANEVKNLSTPLSVTVPVPAGITSVDVYSYNGTAWVSETTGLTVSNGTVSFNITHLSSWACFSAPLSVSTASPLTAGMVGVQYSLQLAAAGGQGPYTWTGTPPAGLVFNASGLISGTPTTPGTSTFTVTASDSAVPKNSVSKQLSLTVNPAALSITTATLPAGTINTAYSTTVQAVGGTTPYTWSATGLPTGVSINTATGVISGTPTVSGSFNSVAITVTDATTANANVTLSLTVNGAQPALNTLTPSCASACHGLPPTTTNQTLSAGGTMPHTTNTRCGVCHLIGGWVAGTTTFNMSGVATHNNNTINFASGLPTASCGACHGLPPGNPHPTIAAKPYVANCGVCHPVGTGNPITMPNSLTTHDNNTINFNP